MRRDHCPVCGHRNLNCFLNRHQVPVHQNLVVATADEACNVRRGSLEMAVCESCGFVFNQTFDAGLLAYGDAYDNTQSCSPFFSSYMDALAKRLVEEHGVKDAVIVEVGCGKGHFLQKLVSWPGAENRGIGFDPSYVGPDVLFDGRLCFQRSYYDQSCANIPADFVVCRHVIEHLPDPLPVLHAVRAALHTHPKAKVFFETPSVEWILRNQVLWDFFYEHCSLFTADSLSLAFRIAGFEVLQVEEIFGGQYLWLEAVPSVAAPGEGLSAGTAGAAVAELAQRYSTAETGKMKEWTCRLQQLQTQGKVALWGAGAKGATFANLVDPDGTLLDCVIDINPNKQGCFVPGTGHPIVAPDKLPERGITHAILMNPNYRDENLALLAEADMSITLLDWS